jgi:hypothetical protein
MTPLAAGATRTYQLVLGARPADYATPGRYEIELLGLGNVALAAAPARCAIVVE